MNYIQMLVDLFLHLDKNLGAVISSYGLWTYLILFVLVFCETGLVLTPFLPRDSLLFVAGAFAVGIGKMNYVRFLSYNLIGGLGWVIIGLLSGYLFGNLPVVRNNFSLVVLAIIFISVLPAIITYFKEKRSCY